MGCFVHVYGGRKAHWAMFVLAFGAISKANANFTVASDGSGNFKSVSQAVAAAPTHSPQPFTIYIKAGVYDEIVEVGSEKTNIVFIGDGIDRTIITGNRSVAGGWSTFNTATVGVEGARFMAQHMTFLNSAGQDKGQAVAFRIQSNQSTLYRCSFVGFQDTLYVKEGIQFFRECEIHGTVDFIFGNSAVVFQNCNLYARMLNGNQPNVITAQGREDPTEKAGIVIQNCTTFAERDLSPSTKTYLGRPWREYSRTVIMQSFLDDFIDPTGWLRWNDTAPVDLLFYAEYQNRGHGAVTKDRVNWPGYKVLSNPSDAAVFTVSRFLKGDEWLPATGVPYTGSLM
ncbi:pectinesterase-like [Magnolia sinica]|uniref:pectinesterase-like n=1 Tax=Magnolia sinica TaxID=86752 RepID=UPI00265ACD78|nr:pectinesterase-like [Magnolia sinica]